MIVTRGFSGRGSLATSGFGLKHFKGLGKFPDFLEECAHFLPFQVATGISFSSSSLGHLVVETAYSFSPQITNTSFESVESVLSFLSTLEERTNFAYQSRRVVVASAELRDLVFTKVSRNFEGFVRNRSFDYLIHAGTIVADQEQKSYIVTEVKTLVVKLSCPKN
jgi:hypothetical protein